MAELPLAPLKRVAKNSGAERIFEEAVEELREVLEEIAEDLAKDAVTATKHAVELPSKKKT